MIDTDVVYKRLKKQNGEKFARVIRDAVLLNVPDLVDMLEFAGNDPYDAHDLVPLIRSLHQENQSRKQYKKSSGVKNKTPIELLNNAGYDAFVVENEKQKNSIQKYYRHGEELCTFKDAHRHENYYIIHAVKRGADKIKPLDPPKRQDKYGTSVISIQIAKTGGFISIKNRYNHTVPDPDATFGNNPDNIIMGLSESLKKYFHTDFTSINDGCLPAHFIIVRNKFIKYNYERNNVYFGDNFYTEGSNIQKIDKDYEFIMNGFVLDTGTGMLQNPSGIQDELYSALVDELFGKKIKTKTDLSDPEIRIISVDNTDIAYVKNGRIQKITLPHLEQCGDDFMEDSAEYLIEANFPNLRKCGDCFLEKSCKLSKLSLPRLEECGSGFLFDNSNKGLLTLDLPNLRYCGDNFMPINEKLKKINLPKLERCGFDFLYRNNSLQTIDFPELKHCGSGFLAFNNFASYVNLPKLKLTRKYINSRLVWQSSDGALRKFYRQYYNKHYAGNYIGKFRKAINKLVAKIQKSEKHNRVDAKSR